MPQEATLARSPLRQAVLVGDAPDGLRLRRVGEDGLGEALDRKPSSHRYRDRREEIPRVARRNRGPNDLSRSAMDVEADAPLLLPIEQRPIIVT